MLTQNKDVYRWGNKNVHLSNGNGEEPYSEDETEFLIAIEAYKRKHNKKFLTWIEALDIAKSLGWRKGDNIMDRRDALKAVALISPLYGIEWRVPFDIDTALKELTKDSYDGSVNLFFSSRNRTPHYLLMVHVGYGEWVSEEGNDISQVFAKVNEKINNMKAQQ
jgi:hypothetical protein